jgi:hypothetical protein
MRRRKIWMFDFNGPFDFTLSFPAPTGGVDWMIRIRRKGRR